MISFRLPALCLLAVLSACASADPEYYTLSSIPGESYESRKWMVEVRRPVIPSTLDRPEMVRQSGDFRIHENENHQWSEPLDSMMERILAEDLRTRLPRSMIVTESSDVPVKAAYVLDIEVEQFGTNAQGKATLEAQMVLRRPDGKTISLPVSLAGAKVTSAESMARALSALLGQCADQAAKILGR